MRPQRPDIVGLEWDDDNEQHILEHVDPWLVDEVIQQNDWSAFPNTRGQPPEHVKIIGRTESGRFVTVILRPPVPSNPGIWRPITAWMAESYEEARYYAERNRRKR